MIPIRMFADVENFATEIGHYFHHQRNLKLSNEYYRICIGVKRKFKKGEIINKDQPNSIDSNGVKYHLNIYSFC